jgi:CheY-like chemotaxis protein
MRTFSHVTEIPGHSPTCGSTASRSWSSTINLRPDVLVADLAMPGTDGYDLIRQVRMLSSGSDLPAVALTALVGSARESALQAGFESYESKPILAGDLVSLVARLADRARSV